MKIKHNGINVSEAQDKAMIKRVRGFASATILAFMASLLVVFILGFRIGTANAQHITKDDLPELVGVFNLGVDLEALSWAVAMQETHNCAKETNFTIVNNCHGIRVWNGERLVPARFPGYINGKRYETSADYFKDLWVRKYDGEVTFDKAVKYSGNDRANYWYNNVKHFYAQAKRTNLEF